ncbi:KPN_02809 family neutral zinc metallopeptidase [Microbacterium sp. NPDC055683]
MTFNENANVGGNRARRRGRTAAVAGGGVAGLGVIGVLVLGLLTGGDFGSLLGLLSPDGGTTTGGSGEGSAIADCETGQDANEDDDCRLAAGSLALDQFWGDTLADAYREPGLVIVDGQTATSCGTASNAAGPFYCPPDETVYVDPTFFSLLRERYDAQAGPLAQLYVLAHEWGHHIQNLEGTLSEHQSSATGPESDGVRTELQADCFAGAWVGDMTDQVDENGVPYLEAPTQAQLADALDAASAVGDDHIQEQSGGFVNPESWSHGSSEQRMRWFQTGYASGVSACDTFAVEGDEL